MKINLIQVNVSKYGIHCNPTEEESNYLKSVVIKMIKEFGFIPRKGDEIETDDPKTLNIKVEYFNAYYTEKGMDFYLNIEATI